MPTDNRPWATFKPALPQHIPAAMNEKIASTMRSILNEQFQKSVRMYGAETALLIEKRLVRSAQSKQSAKVRAAVARAALRDAAIAEARLEFQEKRRLEARAELRLATQQRLAMANATPEERAAMRAERDAAHEAIRRANEKSLAETPHARAYPRVHSSPRHQRDNADEV